MTFFAAAVVKIAASTVAVTTWLIGTFWACMNACGPGKDRREHPNGGVHRTGCDTTYDVANDANLSSSPEIVTVTKTGTGSRFTSIGPDGQRDFAGPSNLQPQATPLIRLHVEDDWTAVTPCTSAAPTLVLVFSLRKPGNPDAKLTMEPNVRSLVCDTCWNNFFSFQAFEAAWLAGTQEHPSFAGTCGCTYWASLQSLCRSKVEGCGWCRLVCNIVEDKVPREGSRLLAILTCCYLS